MAVPSFNVNSLTFNRSVYKAENESSELTKTNTGVKEAVNSVMSQVSDKFIYPQEQQLRDFTGHISDGHKEVPVIDLQGLQGERRSEIVSQIRRASETWGIYQLINHGVPQEIISSMLKSVQEFSEQPEELKKEFYTDDHTKKVQYKVAPWKDTLRCYFEHLSNEEIQGLPSICRKRISDYMRYVTELKDTISELMFEALGLGRDYLKMTKCMEASHLTSYYTMACPDPTFAIESTKNSRHSDPYFLTFLVQNNIDALQVLYENQWIDVNVKEGAIIVNIGDMLQLISNDIFKSVVHRVQVRRIGPRLSSACFFHPDDEHKDRVYGPIKELLEGDNAPAFTDTSHSKLLEHFGQIRSTGMKSVSGFRK